MPLIATVMLVLGALTSAVGILVWYTAATTLDVPNIRGGRRIAAAGRWTAGPAMLLWLGGEHHAGTGMQALLIIATASIAFSLLTKGTPPRPPQPV